MPLLHRVLTSCTLRYCVNNVVSELLTFLTTFTGVFGYGGIALVMIVAAPELVMPFAGFLVVRGDLSFAGVMLAGVAGAMLGQGGIYWAARTLGEARIRRFIGRRRWLLVSERDFERTLRLFDRYETWVVLLGRAVPTVRSLISVPAGIKPMPLARFLLLTATGTALWNALLLYAGMLVGRNWSLVVGVLETYQTIILMLLALGFAALSLRRVRSRLGHWQSR